MNTKAQDFYLIFCINPTLLTGPSLLLTVTIFMNQIGIFLLQGKGQQVHIQQVLQQMLMSTKCVIIYPGHLGSHYITQYRGDLSH